jgi:hypothetical protein
MTTEQAIANAMSEMSEQCTAKDLSRVDAAYWANYNRIKLQKGMWSPDNRNYLLEPMHLQARRICYMKATQGGFTETEILKSLHGMIFKRYPGGVLYLFPTAKDIQDFSKARFGPLIQANRKAIGRFIEKTDNATLKKIGDACLYLRGGTLSKSVGNTADAMEASGLRGITVDRVVYDELDIMDDDVIDKADGRMGDSETEEEVFISNPVLPDSGIAKIFATSDQRHWFRKCLHCDKDPSEHDGLEWYLDAKNGWVSAEVSFPGCVKYHTDGHGYIACPKCGRPVANEPGKWVPLRPEYTHFMQGYRWSQLSSAKRDPGEILNLFNDPPRSKADIVRLKLGLPYVAAEDRLTQSEVLACCSPDFQQMSSHVGPCAMGIDCQKPKRVVIGARTGMDTYTIFRVAGSSDSGWDEIANWVFRFNVKSIVVDIRPYEDMARVFQKRMRKNGVKVFLCEYSETSPIAAQFNTKTGIVKVNRTEEMDSTHRIVTTPGQFILPRRCPEIEEYAKQMCATAKVLELNKRTHQSVYRYRKLGSDDWRHATNYFFLASARGRVAAATRGGERHHRRPTYAINNRRCG